VNVPLAFACKEGVQEIEQRPVAFCTAGSVTRPIG
jgi:hypothetical protein